jgi:hypothetical protein
MLQFQNRLLEISKFCNSKLQSLLKKLKVAAKDFSKLDAQLAVYSKAENFKQEASDMFLEESSVLGDPGHKSTRKK